MTLGEQSLMYRDHFGVECDLEVIRMDGWGRDLWFDETDAPWVMPSPNIPTPDTATVFPGAVFLEGTQMSEGRGTTRPFELVGAPYIAAEKYGARLNGLGLKGVYLRPTYFQPTFQKHGGVTCGGVQIHVIDREEFEPVITGLAIIKVALELYGKDFKWKEPPYEYEFDSNPFDVITGTTKIREALERGEGLESIASSWQQGLNAFRAEREPYLLYS
jgi:uncharacterized protein YbbC (DUF1343 family)